MEVNDFLAHYGRKGMKWGVVRDDDELAKAGPSSGPKTKSSGEVKTAGSSSTPKAKISGETKTSDDTAPAKMSESQKRRRLELEAQYLQAGITGDAAQAKIEKRLKVEKGLKIAGAVAVVGVSAYVVQNQIGKRYAGVTLEKGTTMTYINALGPKADYDRRLYTTFKEGDTKKYRGLLADNLRKNAADTTIYETKLKTTEDIKAPSNKQAAKIYEEMANRGEVMRNPLGYKFFNQGLVEGNDRDAQNFYGEMKKRGYNAILDTNDQFISGYNTKKPLILFNAQSSTVKSGEKIVSEQTSSKLAGRQKAVLIGRSFAPHAAVGAAAIAFSKISKSKTKYDAVNEYIAQNPKTKKTPAEIFASLQKEPDGSYSVPARKPAAKKGGKK